MLRDKLNIRTKRLGCLIIALLPLLCTFLSGIALISQESENRANAKLYLNILPVVDYATEANYYGTLVLSDEDELEEQPYLENLTNYQDYLNRVSREATKVLENENKYKEATDYEEVATYLEEFINYSTNFNEIISDLGNSYGYVYEANNILSNNYSEMEENEEIFEESVRKVYTEITNLEYDENTKYMHDQFISDVGVIIEYWDTVDAHNTLVNQMNTNPYAYSQAEVDAINRRGDNLVPPETPDILVHTDMRIYFYEQWQFSEKGLDNIYSINDEFVSTYNTLVTYTDQKPFKFWIIYRIYEGLYKII